MRHAQAILAATWTGYKQDFIQGDGRVVDHMRGGVSTSEGQSYAMLRSAWMNDRSEFNLTWEWTQHNLQVRHDHLFGYLWGQQAHGNWGILSHDSATDADEDIALALLFAAHQWHDAQYRRDAVAVIRDIWAHEIAWVQGRPYLTAGNWAPRVASPGPVIDPSYLAPYAYRIFARVDPSHDWDQLIDTSYSVLAACTASRLGTSSSAGIPPDWCAIRRSTGAVTAAPQMSRPNIYGYDAFRVMWRVALDWEWNREPRAQSYLVGSDFLRRIWARNGALAAQYHHDGAPVNNSQDPTVYGGDIGNFVVANPRQAGAMVSRKFLPVLHRVGGVSYWDQRYNYYEQNWMWFGLALAAGKLHNLSGL